MKRHPKKLPLFFTRLFFAENECSKCYWFYCAHLIRFRPEFSYLISRRSNIQAITDDKIALIKSLCLVFNSIAKNSIRYITVSNQSIQDSTNSKENSLLLYD